MKTLKHRGKIAAVAVIAVLAAVTFSVYQVMVLRKAHGTFENYYAFRGCTKILSRGDDQGTCKITSGQTIKIVKYRAKWYLDGDLPYCIGSVCF